MSVEQATEALCQAAQQVLESMFFLAADVTILPPAWENHSMLFAQVEFHGSWGGRCAVGVPEFLARTLAGNFTGLTDPAEIRPEIMIQVMCEFTNMICGSTITRMGCPGIVALSPPHLIEEWPRPNRRAQVAECRLDTGEGVVHVSFETEVEA